MAMGAKGLYSHLSSCIINHENKITKTNHHERQNDQTHPSLPIVVSDYPNSASATKLLDGVLAIRITTQMIELPLWKARRTARWRCWSRVTPSIATSHKKEPPRPSLNGLNQSLP